MKYRIVKKYHRYKNESSIYSYYAVEELEFSLFRSLFSFKKVEVWKPVYEYICGRSINDVSKQSRTYPNLEDAKKFIEEISKPVPPNEIINFK